MKLRYSYTVVMEGLRKCLGASWNACFYKMKAVTKLFSECHSHKDSVLLIQRRCDQAVLYSYCSQYV